MKVYPILALSQGFPVGLKKRAGLFGLSSGFGFRFGTVSGEVDSSYALPLAAMRNQKLDGTETATATETETGI